MVGVSHPVQGQSRAREVGADSIWTVELREMVVTATRTPQARERIPLPTEIFTLQDALTRGSMRVADLLGESAGFRVMRNQFGAGIQLRGLDPAYSLVLIDGQPITARTGGTVDLDRLPTMLIERIEIVKGPASSLYGSDALAGVINIITSSSSQPSAQLDLSRETFGTSNLTGHGSGSWGPVIGQATVNRFTSNGYDLIAELPGRTTPAFTDVSGSTKLTYRGNRNLRISNRTRISLLRQQLTTGLTAAAGGLEVPEIADRDGWETSLEVSGRPGGTGIRATLFGSRSSTHTTLYDPSSSDGTLASNFGLDFGKAEILADRILGSRHHATLGAGVVLENASGTRIAGRVRQSRSVFAFVQHSFIPEGPLQLTSSVRIDTHSGYGSRVSPRLAGLWSTGVARFRASVASGFKAPTFQQLYLDFTNPGVGYTVIGSADVSRTLDQYAEAGQIAYLLNGAGSSLRPETAWAVDLGTDWDIGRLARLRASVFMTRLSDMIETQPVAGKPNGQFIFSYANLNRVEIRGAEAQLDVTLGQGLTLKSSYQLLSARDLDVVAEIKRGGLFGRANGKDFRLSPSDYGGLFSRSRHSAAISVSRTDTRTASSLRIIYRSRYGLTDVNGNLVLDDDAEYAPGHAVVNASLSVTVGPHMALQISGYNLTNVTYPTQIPSLSGRVFRAGFTLKTTK
jgi:outer membrane receptor for ferrienterochelin and colicins